jgi:hypothetical protein
MRSWMREASGKLLAIAVLLLAAFVLFKAVLGFLSFIAWTVLGVVAVVGVLWALNRIL